MFVLSGLFQEIDADTGLFPETRTASVQDPSLGQGGTFLVFCVLIRLDSICSDNQTLIFVLCSRSRSTERKWRSWILESCWRCKKTVLYFWFSFQSFFPAWRWSKSSNGIQMCVKWRLRTSVFFFFFFISWFGKIFRFYFNFFCLIRVKENPVLPCMFSQSTVFSWTVMCFLNVELNSWFLFVFIVLFLVVSSFVQWVKCEMQ